VPAQLLHIAAALDNSTTDNMPVSSKAGWIEWLYSDSRKIILQDLEANILPLRDIDLTAEEAWDLMYSHMAEFVREGVVFSQFEARLKSHRAQVKRDKVFAARDKEAFDRDEKLFPRKSHNHRGEPRFDLNQSAKKMLQKDVEEGKHDSMSPLQLQRTRSEYLAFDATIFSDRIRQEVRRQKFINYLEFKREQAEENRKNKAKLHRKKAALLRRKNEDENRGK
jgi:hypothetical protein